MGNAGTVEIKKTRGELQVNWANLKQSLLLKWLPAISLIMASSLVVANTGTAGATVAPIRSDRVILLDVAMAGKRLVAVGERGVVMASDDNGVTWVGTRAPVTRTLTAVTFIDANVKTHPDAPRPETRARIPPPGGNMKRIRALAIPLAQAQHKVVRGPPPCRLAAHQCPA